jgi:hypothetical protein
MGEEEDKDFVLRKEVYVFYGTRAEEKDLATLLALGSLRGLGLGSLGGSNLLALSTLGRSGGSLLLEVLLLLLPFLDLPVYGGGRINV